MIALAMSGILIAAVYAAYNVQQKAYYTQGQVVEMQQNIRSALEIMSNDIRMATYDPGGDAKADIPVANPSRVQVRMDLNDDNDYADANEDVTFRIDDDANNDGISDSGTGNLVRIDNNNPPVLPALPPPIAENINAIQFHYILEDGSKVATPNATEREKIQSVQITILARAELRDAKYTNTEVYTPMSGFAWPVFNDNFRRRMLTSTVFIRNQGLIK